MSHNVNLSVTDCNNLFEVQERLRATVDSDGDEVEMTPWINTVESILKQAAQDGWADSPPGSHDPMGTVYILTVYDQRELRILDQEVFNDLPSFGPDEILYDRTRFTISLRVANINGGDSRAMGWDGDQWQYP